MIGWSIMFTDAWTVLKNFFHKYVSMRSGVFNKYPLLDCLAGPICDDSFLSLLLNPTFSVLPRAMPPVTWLMKSARHLEWYRFTSGKIPIDLHLLPKLMNKEAKCRRKYYVEELLHLNQYKYSWNLPNPVSLASTAATLAFSCNFSFLKSSQKNFSGHGANFFLFLSTVTTCRQMCIAATNATPEFAFQPGFIICLCLQCNKLGFGLRSSHCNVLPFSKNNKIDNGHSFIWIHEARCICCLKINRYVQTDRQRFANA